MITIDTPIVIGSWETNYKLLGNKYYKGNDICGEDKRIVIKNSNFLINSYGVE